MTKAKAPEKEKTSLKIPPPVARRLEAVMLRVEALGRDTWRPPLTKGEVVDLALRALERELDAKKRSAK